MDSAMTAPERAGHMSGRSASVSGASRGIGRAIALRHAEEGAELFVTATYPVLLDESRALAQAQGAKLTLHCADLSQPCRRWWTRRCKRRAASASLSETPASTRRSGGPTPAPRTSAASSRHVPPASGARGTSVPATRRSML